MENLFLIQEILNIFATLQKRGKGFMSWLKRKDSFDFF